MSGNEVRNLHTGCSETLSLDGNVTNWAMVNNRVHDDDNIAIGAIGFEKVSKDPAYDQARQVVRDSLITQRAIVRQSGLPGQQYDGIMWTAARYHHRTELITMSIRRSTGERA